MPLLHGPSRQRSAHDEGVDLFAWALIRAGVRAGGHTQTAPGGADMDNAFANWTAAAPPPSLAPVASPGARKTIEVGVAWSSTCVPDGSCAPRAIAAYTAAPQPSADALVLTYAAAACLHRARHTDLSWSGRVRPSASPSVPPKLMSQVLLEFDPFAPAPAPASEPPLAMAPGPQAPPPPVGPVQTAAAAAVAPALPRATSRDVSGLPPTLDGTDDAAAAAAAAAAANPARFSFQRFLEMWKRTEAADLNNRVRLYDASGPTCSKGVPHALVDAWPVPAIRPIRTRPHTHKHKHKHATGSSRSN
jgi:hypothetical protein